MNKIVLLSLIMSSLFANVACNGDFHHDPLKNHEEVKDYVPVYDRDLRVQYYLSDESVEIKTETVVEFVRGEERQLEVTFNVDFMETSHFYLQSSNFPEWLKIERVVSEESKYLISGTPPKDFIASGVNGEHKIKLKIIPKDSVPENIKKRLSYYETEKEISLVFVNGKGA